jgi:dGTPase
MRAKGQLDRRMREYGDRFDHNLHALRIVEQFEQRYLAFPGLNLTFEVREGIVKHSRDRFPEHIPEIAEYLLSERPPLEAQLIDLVDEIAYNTADLDDGFEAHLLDFDALRAAVPVFATAYAEVDRRYPAGPRRLKFNEALRLVIDRLATDLIENTRARLEASGAQTVEDVRLPVRAARGLFAGGRCGERALKRFLNTQLYSHPTVAEERDQSVAALDALFVFFMEQPGPHAAKLCEDGAGAAEAPRGLRLYCRDDGSFSPEAEPRIARRSSTSRSTKSRPPPSLANRIGLECDSTREYLLGIGLGVSKSSSPVLP